MKDTADKVLYYVERSNQRGGRMLSVIDLIRAGTISKVLSVWMLSKILRGSSWVVGAKPGGAGKTTIMSAFLCMLPQNEEIYLTTYNSGWESAPPGSCILSYEISRGNYDAYIWGDNVKKFINMGKKGCRLVTNIHADTLKEAEEQIVYECNTKKSDFQYIDIFIPISISQKGLFSISRKINKIYYYYRNNEWKTVTTKTLEQSEEINTPLFQGIISFLDFCIEKNICLCEEVRQEWLSLEPKKWI